VFEYRVLRGISGPKRAKMVCRLEKKKLHNEVLQNLFSSQNIITIINSRRVGWAGIVA
jgi:hypothetical protein